MAVRLRVSIDKEETRDWETLEKLAGVPAGTYFVYTTNLNYLSNDTEDRGGMMTEVVIN